MKAFHIILFSACLIGAPIAHADESPFKGGMNYTTIGQFKASPPNTAGGLKQKNIKPPTLPDESPAEDTPADKVWKKYKALAAGEAQEEIAAVDNTPKETDEPAVKEGPAKTTGIAALIEKYEQNKQRQSQMQTIEITRPKAPTKPVVETPDN